MAHLLAVQLTHPGHQKAYNLGNGYVQNGARIIREWNSDRSHFRKFMLNEGEYIKSLHTKNTTVGDLLFWGEWEGFSEYAPLNPANSRMPNGLHRPFHSLPAYRTQNTDPYVFGNNFYYAICKQYGRRCDLAPGSLILFGTSFEDHFALDTVFVVDSHETAHQVVVNPHFKYSRTYIEETLDQIKKQYRVPKAKQKLYSSLTWFKNSNYFSFVPCKLAIPATANGFERVKIPYNAQVLPAISLSSNPTGTKYLAYNSADIFKVWESIVAFTLQQGFYLGIKFLEPTSPNQALSKNGSISN